MASISSSTANSVQDSNINSVSAVNVSNFVSAKLHLGVASNNYITWKEQMLCLIESQDLLGFIDGEVVPPPSPEKGETKSKDYVGWRRKDRLVKGWILGAVSDELVRKCVGIDTARNVWMSFEWMYTNLPRVPPPPPPPPPPRSARTVPAGLRSVWAPPRHPPTSSDQLVFVHGSNINSVSAVNVSNFVPEKLQLGEVSNNYMSWKEQMLCLIESEDLLGFIDGEVVPPPSPEKGKRKNKYYVAWRRKDRLVKGWILGAVSDELVRKCVGFDTARNVWIRLEQLSRLPPPPPPPPPPFHQFVFGKGSSEYLKLYQAAVRCHRTEVRQIMSPGHNMDPVRIAYIIGTVLHAAARTRMTSHDMEQLLDIIPCDILQLQTWNEGNTLHIAASTGNTDVAKFLIKKFPALLNQPTRDEGLYPIHLAARSAHRDTLELLMSYEKYSPAYVGSSGVLLLCNVIDVEFYDIALRLVDKYPYLSTMKHDESGESALEILSQKVLAFPSGARFNLYQHLVNSCIGWLERTSEAIPQTSDIMATPRHVGNESEAIPQTSDIKAPPGPVDNESKAIPQTSDIMPTPGNDIDNESKAIPQQTSDIESAPGHVGKESKARPLSSGIEDPTDLRKWYKILVQKLQFSLVVVIDKLVPCGRSTHMKKLKHEQATKLLKCLCKNMLLVSEKEVKSISSSAMMMATRLGNLEVVQEIERTFPLTVYAGLDGHYFFRAAVENRSNNVMHLMINRYSELRDSSGNTVLHLVAKLAPPDKLNLVSGAALQMQIELQWFKEVCKYVDPYVRETINNDGKKPRRIFTEEHKSLKEEGEKWMKDTASSCIIAASLIATVVFATGITVPGGNNPNGYPLFRTSTAFIIFAISDVISLFTSITSLLMFLSIMTSRYAEEDFMYSLPKRLSIGLITLFISIFFMMVTFSAATYLVLGQEQKWVLISVATLACLPIFSFVLLQFPLLVDVVSSTYGNCIFVKKVQGSPFL